MEKEELIEHLRGKKVHVNYYEDSDPEVAYRNGIYSELIDGLEKGILDPAVLGKNIGNGVRLVDDFNNGVDYHSYDEYVKEYVAENGLDLEEYRVKRKEVIAEETERVVTKAIHKRYGDDVHVEMRKSIIGEIGDLDNTEMIVRKLSYLEKSAYQNAKNAHNTKSTIYDEEYNDDGEYVDDVDETIPEKDDGVSDELIKTAVYASLPANVEVKNNWLNKLKNWFRKISKPRDNEDKPGRD